MPAKSELPLKAQRDSANDSLPAAVPDEAEVVRRILRALAGLEFGSVEIIVQNSKVVQIERTQRSRFVQPLDIPRA